MNYAGTHLIIDLFGAKNLSSVPVVNSVLSKAAKTIGATILDVKFHYFEPQGGVTGVVLLAESHMSIHTWPENNYAAVDIFVCGKLDPSKAIELLKEVFQPESIQCVEIKRGMMP